ncbi:MAG: S-layer homology domain-containing protein [Clostridia bacterium]|nr:S-layer homology domain-containing protein [Clostridia bacterium]
MKKRIIAISAVVMMLFSQSVSAVNFTDITNHWAKASILTLAEKGVVNGVTDTQFMPDGEVTRAQYLKMIMEATGVKTAPVREGECLDVDGDDWYGVYLQGALDCGLIPKDMVTGYSENVDYAVDENGNATYTKVIYKGAFNGNLPIKREEMAVLTQYMYQYTRTILTNKQAEKTKAIEFADAGKISEWAKTSVNQAVANGFMDGMDDNMFNPELTATRAQAATVILRVLNK